MTQGPDQPHPDDNPEGQQPPSGAAPPPPYGAAPPPYGQMPPPHGQVPPPHGQPGPGQPGPGYNPAGPGYGYGQPGPGYGYAPAPGAPYGVHPRLGVPYSEKSKIVAGVLQIVLPLGIGRFYIGDTGLGIAQLLVTILTCGVGALWPFIDGIIMLVTDSTDAEGRLLRS